MRTLLILGLVCAPLVASSEEPPETLDNLSKVQLWKGGQRYRSKWLDAVDAGELTTIELGACQKRLQSRTSTAVRALAVPPEAPPPSGHTTEIVIVVGVAAAAIGVILGAILSKDAGGSVIVNSP